MASVEFTDENGGGAREVQHRVFIAGQKRGVFGAIKRELRRHSAIEPVIGHMQAEGHPLADGYANREARVRGYGRLVCGKSETRSGRMWQSR
jgi:hypothetical protein